MRFSNVRALVNLGYYDDDDDDDGEHSMQHSLAHSRTVERTLLSFIATIIHFISDSECYFRRSVWLPDGFSMMDEWSDSALRLK